MSVYFIRSGGRIKIGYTSNWSKRLRSFTRALPEPPEIIAVIDGGREAEAWLHSRFDELRVNGEWFKSHADIEEMAHKLASDRFAIPVREKQQETSPSWDVERYLAEAMEWFHRIEESRKAASEKTTQVERRADIARRLGVDCGSLENLARGRFGDALRLRGLRNLLYDARVIDIDCQIIEMGIAHADMLMPFNDEYRDVARRALARLEAAVETETGRRWLDGRLDIARCRKTLGLEG